MSARSLGRAAGRVLLAPSLNPYPHGSVDHDEWEGAWRIATGEQLSERDAERRRRAGHLAASACTELGT